MSLALICCAACLFLPVNAQAKGMNWYCNKVVDNCRPLCPFDEKMLKENQAYFLGKDEKKVYLTFDAGYCNENVEKIVEVLKKRKVNAAFFVLEHFVTSEPELCKDMAENSILICNHTTSHKNIALLSEDELKDQICSLEGIYEDATGLKMERFFRPPEGCFSEESLKLIKGLGYKTVFWSVAYADWDNNNQPSQKDAMEKILSRVHNGAVILLHPTSKTNADILDELITELENRGYSFGSLKEL